MHLTWLAKGVALFLVTIGAQLAHAEEPLRVEPRLVKVGKIEYPPASLRNKENGKVTLNLLIDAEGKATDAKVETSSGSPFLDEAAREASLSSRYAAGTVDGVAAQMWTKVNVIFRCPSTGDSANKGESSLNADVD